MQSYSWGHIAVLTKFKSSDLEELEGSWWKVQMGRKSKEEDGDNWGAEEEEETGRQLRRKIDTSHLVIRQLHAYTVYCIQLEKANCSTWKPLMRLRPCGDLELRAVLVMKEYFSEIWYFCTILCIQYFCTIFTLLCIRYFCSIFTSGCRRRAGRSSPGWPKPELIWQSDNLTISKSIC